MSKIGFIGYGNMGQMVINNILSLKLLKEEEIILSNRTMSKLDNLKEKYPLLEVTSDNSYLAKKCNKIFIFVETPEFKTLLEEIATSLNENSHIIHVCAGLTFENISNIFHGKVSQVIPTIISTYNEIAISNQKYSSNNNQKGISLILHNSKLDLNDKNFVESLFNKFSYIKILDTDRNNKNNTISRNGEKNDEYKDIGSDKNNDTKIATILTSCGPAFLSLVIRKIAITACKNTSLSYLELENMLIKTMLGTSIQLNDKNLDIDEILTKTTTKKGITENGLKYLDNEVEKIVSELFSQLLLKYEEVENNLNKEYCN
ncbi:pyrroline-5-carboxylate reductase [Methanobrevibacter cuticularis]|uniref:Pyrroline-5-carboxylate reductase n=1 Tax=Methanobrevibacter cuticularis TaxID=47311 RepID=A0A166E1S3_9EURY|nr:pyrroline-5-carboxylate reductase dimerization domain-containing protein [Methanobrevibacter cuticularis]KZX16181.1 pyrroline-5-carboxylate reductase [Methanobrevibacter cuticularis]